MLFKAENLIFTEQWEERTTANPSRPCYCIVDFGFSVQDAIEAPRWLNGRTWGASSNDLKIEGRVPKTVTAELIKRGHPVKVVDDYTDTMGHAGAIRSSNRCQIRWCRSTRRRAAVGY